MKTALVTYLYPNVVQYIDALIKTIEGQTAKDFRLVVFNDGVLNAEKYFDQLRIPFQVIPIDGDVLGIRLKSLEILSKREEYFFVFLDADDEMSPNRIECCVQYLDNGYAVVCNDLQLVSEQNLILTECIWKTRLGNRFEFDSTFISDKNICGLGNSAVRRELLEKELIYVAGVNIADWFIFGQLLHAGDRLIFISDCVTLYKQHGNNIGGFPELDTDRLNYILDVRRKHFSALEIAGKETKELRDADEALKLRMEEKKEHVQIPSNDLLWWEIPKELK